VHTIEMILKALHDSDEHPTSIEPVSHPVDRLVLLHEARPAIIIPAGPTDRPPAGAHPLDEFETVSACLVEYLVVRHDGNRAARV
jgi:hypothetical protein